MYDAARRLRSKDKQITVKRTDVSVDLNALLGQIQDGGIVVIYRCPQCSGKLKIDKSSNIQTIGKCEYCNTEIESMELADFLNTALS